MIVRQNLSRYGCKSSGLIEDEGVSEFRALRTSLIVITRGGMMVQEVW